MNIKNNSATISSPIDTKNKFSFARHETFHLRDGWIYKGLRATQSDRSALFQPEAHHYLGIGINMLKSMIYWLQATNLASVENARSNPFLSLTPLAKLLILYDPYFENVTTNWLMHIALSTNVSQATFWYWIFNEYNLTEFSVEQLQKGISDYIKGKGINAVASSSLKKDIYCFIHTYDEPKKQKRRASDFDVTDSPLTALGILKQSSTPGYYKLQVGPHTNLSSETFCYALYKYREMLGTGEVTVSIDDLRWSPRSPGRILCLDNSSIMDHLEILENKHGLLRIVRSPDITMVALDSMIKSETLIRMCYRDQRLGE